MQFSFSRFYSILFEMLGKDMHKMFGYKSFIASSSSTKFLKQTGFQDFIIKRNRKEFGRYQTKRGYSLKQDR